MFVLCVGQTHGIRIHQIQTLKKKLRGHHQVNHRQGRLHHQSPDLRSKVERYHVGNIVKHQMNLASTVMMTMKVGGMQAYAMSNRDYVEECLNYFTSRVCNLNFYMLSSIIRYICAIVHVRFEGLKNKY